MTTVSPNSDESQVSLLLDRARLRHEWERVQLGWAACALCGVWFFWQWALDRPGHYGAVVALLGIYISFTAWSTLSLKRNPRVRWRLPLLIVVDAVTLSGVLLLTHLPTSPFFFFYYLIVLGTLLRFGEPLMRLALLASLLTYAVAVIAYQLLGLPDGPLIFSMEAGKILALIGLPLHTTLLLRKMEERRKGYQTILEAIERYIPGGNDLAVYVGDDDEAQALARHLNTLTIRVREQHEDLVKLALDLERLVDERTSQLSEQVEATKAAQKARIQFLNNLSHELRTPLHSIIGFSEILISRGEGDTPHMARLVHRNGVALLKRIEDMTDLTQLMSGQMRSEPVATNLVDLIGSALDSVGPMAEKKEVVLESAIDPSIGLLKIDGRLAVRLLVELLDNAVKFSPVKGTVIVSATWVEGSLTLVVTDEGEGVADEVRPWVFELFHQAEGDLNRRHEGLGIGLSMVKILTDLMGGSASIKNCDGKGARVTISLPAESVKGKNAR